MIHYINLPANRKEVLYVAIKAAVEAGEKAIEEIFSFREEISISPDSSVERQRKEDVDSKLPHHGLPKKKPLFLKKEK